MAHVRVNIGEIDYAVDIKAGRHQFMCDEPQALGGADAGPAPYDLLLGSLGACTAITLRMYAKRKSWALRSVQVELHLHRDDAGTRITRVLSVEGELDSEQRERLLAIAEKTPVTLTLKSGTPIETRYA